MHRQRETRSTKDKTVGKEARNEVGLVVWVSLRGAVGSNTATLELASILTQIQLQRGPMCRTVLQVALG